MPSRPLRSIAHCATLILLLAAVPARAEDSRLLATGGAMSVEGAGGGGLNPWATLAALSSGNGFGASAGLSWAHTGDYSLGVLGIALSWHDRFEVSLAEQDLRLDTLRTSIDLRRDDLRQQILGAKLRLAGDLIYDTLPQFSLGVEAKHLQDAGLATDLGARDDHGIDAYLSVARLILDGPWHRNLLLNASVRATRANQFGLLGFGGDRDSGYRLLAEGSAALFLDPHWALGAEYRQKSDNLRAAREDDACDVFLGWFPNKRVSLILAYLDLGPIGGLQTQRGYYLSVNATY
jgi:Protein of unknown function (DUF3034)